MRVIAINGSPHKNGNTYESLAVVTKELEKQGIETEIVHIGNKVIRGCTGCNYCQKNEQNNADHDVDFAGFPHKIAIPLRQKRGQRYCLQQNNYQKFLHFEKFHLPKIMKSCLFC